MSLRSLLRDTLCAAVAPTFALALVLCDPTITSGQTCAVRRVPRAELRRAMSMHGDYQILATMNRGRFTGRLLLRLAGWAKDRDPEGNPLLINPDDWLLSFVSVAGVSAQDAPLSARLGFEHGQRVFGEYRDDRVIRRVREGPEPLLAVNVRAWWPDGPDVPSSFSFTDTTAVPTLKATTRREVTYRLLEYDDMVVLDRIAGLSGRPVSGLLGALFTVMGEGGLKHSRIGVADDGLQVARARAKKLFSHSTTVTIEPDGRAKKGIPEGRADLAALEARTEESPRHRVRTLFVAPRPRGLPWRRPSICRKGPGLGLGCVDPVGVIEIYVDLILPWRGTT